MNGEDGRPAAADDRTALAPGTRIGNTYLILKTAERGSAALCYEGLRLADQAAVTLYEFCPRGIAVRSQEGLVAPVRGWEQEFEAARERFSQRCERLGRIADNAIVKPIGQIDDLGTLYVVCEAATGPTLSSWASDLLRRPSDEDMARLALRLGKALRALHRAGEAHGAVGEAQIHVSAPEDVVLAGVLLETVDAAGGAQPDVRALASALYSVIVGRKPPPENRDRSLDARFSALHMASGDYADSLLALVDAALEFGEDAEKVDPAGWLDSLIAATQGTLGEDKVATDKAVASPPVPVADVAETKPRSRPERPARSMDLPASSTTEHAQRRKSPLGILAAVAVVLVGVAGWLAYQLLGQAPGKPPAPKVAVQTEAPAKPATAPAPTPKPETPAPVATSSPAPKPEPPPARTADTETPTPARPAPQVSVVLPELPPVPPPPSRPAVTASDIRLANSREAALALLERGGDRVAILARLAELGFLPVSAGGETVFRKAAGGESWRDCSTCPELVLAPPGKTTMQITIADKTQSLDFRFDRPLAVARYEVTRGQYAAFVRETGKVTGGGCHARSPSWGLNPALSWENPGFAQTDDHPVVCVSFQDAAAYAEWLSARTGQRYRLPTDAEWHYLAAAEKWSERQPDQLCAIGNGADRSARAGNPDWQHADCDDGAAATAQVGKYAAGPWGLHDLNGNAWEWVATCAPEPRPDAEFPPRTCPAGAPRLLRGGSWADAPRLRQLDSRVISAPTVRDQVAGFRVVRDP